MYRIITKFAPKSIRDNYAKMLAYANIEVDANKFVGFILVFGLLLSIALTFYLTLIFQFKINLAFIAAGLFVLIEAGVYMWLMLNADNKAKFIESVLPDALSLMASNLRAGYTVDRALLLSTRPEFGPLTQEIMLVGKKISTGGSLSDGLQEISKHVKSEKLEKTVSLVISGLRSGGELASLLEQTAKNLREQEFIDQKIRSSVLMYVIFIFSAICIGAPMLFGLSSVLVKILSSKLAEISIPAGIDMPFAMKQVAVSQEFVIQYSVISLTTTCILGSLVLGIISKGKEREGLKFILPLVAAALAIFFGIRAAITSLLSGLLL